MVLLKDFCYQEGRQRGGVESVEGKVHGEGPVNLYEKKKGPEKVLRSPLVASKGGCFATEEEVSLSAGEKTRGVQTPTN